jgi:hypothetical protein
MSELAEQRIARSAAIALPFVTMVAALVVGVALGPAMAILVVAAGLLLGVIALFWNSLRILSGDAAVSPELEALDLATRGVDGLAARKKMLLRALKDLDNERGLGKLEDEDYAPIAETYRAELKAVLRSIDESLAPHREKAETLAREHLEKAGLGETEKESIEREPEQEAPSRRECPQCKASNELDAKFCKECATKLEVTA